MAVTSVQVDKGSFKSPILGLEGWPDDWVSWWSACHTSRGPEFEFLSTYVKKPDILKWTCNPSSREKTALGPCWPASLIKSGSCGFSEKPWQKNSETLDFSFWPIHTLLLNGRSSSSLHGLWWQLLTFAKAKAFWGTWQRGNLESNCGDSPEAGWQLPLIGISGLLTYYRVVGDLVVFPEKHSQV